MTKSQIIEFVIKPIEKAGFDAYFVGGCVRDELMKKEPHDYDICTNATPAELHTIFSVFSEQNSEPFGVTMPIINKELVEIATMRKDITKGRHPTIIFTKDITEDANRRDFTVNALYEKADGTILDPTGQGIDDIKNNKLRFVGQMKDRLSEDPLRAFRYVRFLAQKGFDTIDEKTIEAELGAMIQSPADFYKEVSAERKLKELIGIFGGKYLCRDLKQIFHLMEIFGIDEVTGIKDIIQDLKSCPQTAKWHAEGSFLKFNTIDKDGNIFSHIGTGADARKQFIRHNEIEIVKVFRYGNVFDHTIKVMEEMAKSDYDYIDMMAAFLHDIGKPESGRQDGINEKTGLPKTKRHPDVGAPIAYEFCKSLKMTNADSELLSNLVLYHMDMHKLSSMKSDYSVMKIMSLPYFDRLVKLARADHNGGYQLAFDDEMVDIDEALATPRLQRLLNTPIPEPVVTGDYLISKGYKPGPLFKKVLEVAMKIQVDQNKSNPDEIFSGIRSILD